MTQRQVRLAHCYRCVYTWRMRYRWPRVCPRCKSRYWSVPKTRPVSMGDGLGIEDILAPHRDDIQQLARRYGARSLRVFGSVRRREADARSDVDLIVRWKPGTSLLQTARFRVALRELLKRDVHTVEEDLLHWSIRAQVLAEAVPL